METNNIFKQDAKSLVDTLFETKIFKDNLTRDDLNAIEELISYSMYSRYDCVMRAEKLFEKVNKNGK